MGVFADPKLPAGLRSQDVAGFFFGGGVCRFNGDDVDDVDCWWYLQVGNPKTMGFSWVFMGFHGFSL